VRTSLLISGGRLIDPCQGMDMVGDLLIMEGKVTWAGAPGSAPFEQEYSLLHARGMVVSPGFIDLHCHLREPGFEEKETVATGTKAATRGGFTSICCMPNTSPPVDSPAIVEYIRSKAIAEGIVRVFPIGCISKGQRGEELVEMGGLAEAGVVAFSDDGKSVASSQLMRHALESSCLFGLPIIDHCEDTSLTEGGVMNEGSLAVRLGLRGMPAAAEATIGDRDIVLAQLAQGRLHIAHVSTAASVELIRRAKRRGIRVTAEVTPHHLTLTEERVIGYDTNAKVNPPLRTEKDTEALLQGLEEGVIDAVATDHAPHTTQDKACQFDLAAFGISGLETALGVLLSLVHQGKLDLVTLVSKLTAEPARIIEGNKSKEQGTSSYHSPLPSSLSPVPLGLGTLKVGAPGDVTIFDPDLEWVVNPDLFASKGKNNPWAGCLLKGKVMATMVGGEVVYKENALKIETIRH
jgi:dihydroorotase